MATRKEGDGFVRELSGPAGAGSPARPIVEQGQPDYYGGYARLAAGLGTALSKGSTADPKNSILNKYSVAQQELLAARDQGAISGGEYETRARQLHAQWQGQWGAYKGELDTIYSGFQARDTYGNMTIAMQKGAVAAEESLAKKAMENGMINPYSSNEEVAFAINQTQRMNFANEQVSLAAKELAYARDKGDFAYKNAEAVAKNSMTRSAIEHTAGGLQTISSTLEKITTDKIPPDVGLRMLDDLRDQFAIAETKFAQYTDSSTKEAMKVALSKALDGAREIVSGKSAVTLQEFQYKNRLLGQSISMQDNPTILKANATSYMLSGVYTAPLSSVNEVNSAIWGKPDRKGKPTPGNLATMTANSAQALTSKIGETISNNATGKMNKQEQDDVSSILEGLGTAAANSRDVDIRVVNNLVKVLSSEGAGALMQKVRNNLTKESKEGLLNLVTRTQTALINQNSTGFFSTDIRSPSVDTVDGSSAKLMDVLDFTLDSKGRISIDPGENYDVGDLKTIVNYSKMKGYQDSINQALQFYANYDGTSLQEAMDKYGASINPLIFPTPAVKAGVPQKGADGRNYRWNGTYPVGNIHNWEPIDGNTR